jgi:replicative DNA helicase
MDILGRLPPQAIEAEQSVIGSLLIESQIYDDLSEIISSDDFYRAEHKEIYTAIEELQKRNSTTDIITVSDSLRCRGTLDKIGGLEYLTQIASNVPTTANAIYYAKIVHDKYLLRSLIKSSTSIIDTCYEQSQDIETIIQTAESQILQVNQNNKSDMSPVSEVLVSTLNEIEDRCKNKGQFNGLATGLVDLDFKLRGLKKGDLIILAARPSMGKTALAGNISDYVALTKNIPVAFFSLEMSKEKLMSRTLSGMAMIENTRIQLGTLDDDDFRKMANIYGVVGEGKLEIDDTPNQKITEIRSKCRRMKKKYGDLGLIIIDHLTELWRPMKGNDFAEYSENIRACKRLAVEMQCPLILLQQLNRGVEARSDKRPVLSDLRETGVAEEAADVVLMIYRDDYYNKDSNKKNIAEILIRKGRDIGTGTVELVWLPQYTKFVNLRKC